MGFTPSNFTLRDIRRNGATTALTVAGAAVSNVDISFWLYPYVNLSNGYLSTTTPYQTAIPNTAIASATTIAPTTQMFSVSGTASISTITPPAGFSTTQGGCLNALATGAWKDGHWRAISPTRSPLLPGPFIRRVGFGQQLDDQIKEENAH